MRIVTTASVALFALSTAALAQVAGTSTRSPTIRSGMTGNVLSSPDLMPNSTTPVDDDATSPGS